MFDHRRTLLLAAALLAPAATLAAQTDPVYIYGLHDSGGETLMGANKGWITFTVRCSDAGRDYRTWSNQGYGVIVRLNYGYEPQGTLPPEAQYGTFATQCGNYVAASPGVNYWIVANEPNLSREWPEVSPGVRQPITVARYVNAYNQVWSAIRARVSTAKIAPAPSGTYGPPDAANNIPGFVDYWQQVISQISSTRIQALILHTYTHGCDPNLIFSEQKFTDPPYTAYYYHFRVYKNYLAIVPTGLRSLPVLITETDQNVECADNSSPRRAWSNTNSGWVKNAYQEINSWNTTSGNQKIRALVLFRWDMANENGYTYGISALNGVRTDFQEAVARAYRWDTGSSCSASVPSTSWRGDYYPNISLSGTPSLVRNDGTGNINFNWGSGGPNTCGIGVDNFSVRWTRTVSFSAGTWRFSVTSDDGFRLYVDNVLKLDKWFDQAPTTYTVDVALTAANHTLKLEWYEKGGGATAQLSWALVGSGGNNATVLTSQSSVPSSLSPGQVAQVRVRVQNTGGTTWSASSLYRLGAQSSNAFTWRDFNCGGYSNSPADSRSFLCNSVGPNQTYDFVFNIQAPSSSGSYTFSVRMVQDGVQWFGTGASWTISVGSSNPYPSCPCTAGYDNYCNHPPRTTGCPMTFGGGYCDPNGDLSYADADWVRGYNEFQQYCR